MQEAKTASRKPFNRIDLDKHVQDFMNWEKTTANVVHENNCLQLQLKALTKQLQISQAAENTANEEVNKLGTLVDKLQNIISKRCDLEDENTQLKQQIKQTKEAADTLEQEHKKQMMEALNNLEASEQEHKKELTRTKEEYLQQTKCEVALLEKSLQEKNGELRQFQKQLVDMERDKHTEIVKLRLEYDAKLLRLQKSNAKAQTAQSSNVNSDIFRKKLQFAKAEADKEIMSLKNKVADLERKIASHQYHPQMKRKRF